MALTATASPTVASHLATDWGFTMLRMSFAALCTVASTLLDEANRQTDLGSLNITILDTPKLEDKIKHLVPRLEARTGEGCTAIGLC